MGRTAHRRTADPDQRTPRLDEHGHRRMHAALTGMRITLEVAGMRLTHDEAMVIAEFAVRLGALRRKAWGMANNKGRSHGAAAMRRTLQQAERELDEAIDTIRTKRNTPASTTTTIAPRCVP
jgi:hypothetical protein